MSEHYASDFDWFFLGGDDCFLLVDALKRFLESSQIAAARASGSGLYIGRRFKIDPSSLSFNLDDNAPTTFNGGGPGYVLDSTALKMLGKVLSEKEDLCEGSLAKLVDDVPIAVCLSKLGILAFDSRDENGRDRFHHFSTENVAETQLYGVPIELTWWGQSYVDFIPGIKGISDDSITFQHNLTFQKRNSRSSLWVDFYLSSCKNKEMD